MPPQVLFQSYTNAVPTAPPDPQRRAGRDRPRRAAARLPSWTEYLVIVPEPDGTSRIDDVLFATRRSDTLRARLAYYALAR